MPIYEYECEKCKDRFEVMQRMSDPPVTACSHCKGKVHKVISSPSGLVFKGSGWYITDYARKNESAPSKKETNPPAPEGKSESKTNAETPKTETKNPPPKN